MAKNTAAMKRGWIWDEANSKLKVYVNGVSAAEFTTTGGSISPAGSTETTTTATAFYPSTSDGNALGTSTYMWSDLFLASGAVINFNNGDVTLTHSSNTLALAGGNLSLTDAVQIIFGASSDVTVQWEAAGSFLFSAAADDSKIEIGDSAATQKSFDVTIYGDAANGATYMKWDASANSLDLVSTLAGTGDDSFSVTTTDNTADGGATHYGRGGYINYTNAGIKSAAGSEGNGLGVDINASANVVSLYGISLYTGACNGATINRTAALAVYNDTLTGTVTASSCLYLGMNGGATSDDFIAIRSFTGTQDAIISDRSGGATATNLLLLAGVNAPAEAYNAAGNGAYSIKCSINSVTTYIHTYDAP